MIDKTSLLPSVMHLKWIFYASCFKISTTLNQIPSYSFSGLSHSLRLRLGCVDDQTGGTKKIPWDHISFSRTLMGRKSKETQDERGSNVARTLIPAASVLPISSTNPSNQPLRRLQRNPRRRDARFNLFAVFAVDAAQIFARVRTALLVM